MADGGSLVISSGQMRAIDAGCGNAVLACPKPTVSIELSAATACPGHPLPIEAKGSPGGGSYRWTVDGAELVDGSGRPRTDGANVHLTSFTPDPATGRIPARKATVSVTYTHPNGIASASKDVPVHAIDFDLTASRPAFTQLEAKEDGAGVFIASRDPNTPTMNVDSQVKIRIDASCPRKKECAANHRVGWLQDVIAWDKSYRFRHRLVQWKLAEGPPMRDAVAQAPAPFYSDAFDFTDDGDYFRVNHSDSPAFGALWEDEQHTPPQQSPLEAVTYKLGFAAWLVVQNREESERSVAGSLVYLANFEWGFDCVLTRVETPVPGRRLGPRWFTPTLGATGKGRGGRTPSLTSTSANNDAKPKSTGIP